MSCSSRSPGARVLPLLVVAVLLFAATAANGQLRPLVRTMLESVAAIEVIGAGLATLDFARIRAAAEQLQGLGETLKQHDAEALGIGPARKPQFDGFLAAQQSAVGSIREAALARDANGVLLGLRSLQSGCTTCHAGFRVDERKLRPAALFMTSLLSAWQDMNRGIMTDDFELVVRRAREMQATARVFSWEQVLDATFDIADAGEMDEFRRLLAELTRSAYRIEQQAMETSHAGVLDAMTAMWNDSCLSCHERFRGGASPGSP